MYFAYILKSRKTGKYYIGSTSNLSRRLSEHNMGKNKSTKSDTPWDVYYCEEFEDNREAVLRERQIKGWKKRAMIEKLKSRESSILQTTTGVVGKIGKEVAAEEESV